MKENISTIQALRTEVEGKLHNGDYKFYDNKYHSCESTYYSVGVKIGNETLEVTLFSTGKYAIYTDFVEMFAADKVYEKMKSIYNKECKRAELQSKLDEIQKQLDEIDGKVEAPAQ